MNLIDMPIPQIRKEFQKRFTHVYIGDVDDEKIKEYISQRYLLLHDQERQFSYMYDWLMANGLCDVEE